MILAAPLCVHRATRADLRAFRGSRNNGRVRRRVFISYYDPVGSRFFPFSFEQRERSDFGKLYRIIIPVSPEPRSPDLVCPRYVSAVKYSLRKTTMSKFRKLKKKYSSIRILNRNLKNVGKSRKFPEINAFHREKEFKDFKNTFTIFSIKLNVKLAKKISRFDVLTIIAPFSVIFPEFRITIESFEKREYRRFDVISYLKIAKNETLGLVF